MLGGVTGLPRLIAFRPLVKEAKRDALLDMGAANGDDPQLAFIHL
jgi:hypothetical protein